MLTTAQGAQTDAMRFPLIMLAMLQELMARCFVVNAPTVMSMIYKALSVFMDAGALPHTFVDGCAQISSFSMSGMPPQSASAAATGIRACAVARSGSVLVTRTCRHA